MRLVNAVFIAGKPQLTRYSLSTK